MTDGFQDPITAGTNLVIPAINSPNYVLGVTGWAIRKDGTAQFTGIVIIGGTITGTNFIINSAGAFFYSGTPANGNLFCSIASVAGTDGFGNAYGSGVNVGDQGGAHLAISTLGDLLIANAANLPVAFLYHGDGSLRLYNPAGIVAGNLKTVISPVAGTDSAGNAYPRGITQFSALRETLYGVLDDASLQFVDTVNAPFGNSKIILSAVHTTNDALLITGPLALSTDTNPLLLLIRAPTGSAAVMRVANASFQVGAPVFAAVADNAGPQLFTTAAGQLLYIASNATGGGDSNTYDTARLTLPTSGGTISLVAFTTIGGLTKNVGIGKYKFRVHLMYVGNGTGVAASPLFRMRSPAFSSGSLQLVGLANGPLVSVRFDNVSGFGSSLSAPALAAGDSTTRYNVVIEGSATFTAAGGFDVQASIGAAGNAQFVIAAGSTFELEPVVAA